MYATTLVKVICIVRLRLLITAVILISITNTLSSQYLNSIQSHIPLNPTAASLVKNAEIGDLSFSGSAVLNYPLFQVESNKLAHNISLSYNTAGIKLSETASNVGLGFSLNAGGVISRQVRGGPDEGLDGFSTGYYSDPYDVSQANQHDLQQIEEGLIDIESDLYFFNFDGYSGSFFFDENQNIIQRDKSDIIIIPIVTSYNFNKFLWKVITPNGNIYYFGDDVNNESYVDDAVSYSNNYSAGINLPGGPDITNPMPDSWHLVKITTHNDDSVIEFNYDKFEYYSFRNLADTPNAWVTPNGLNLGFDSGMSITSSQRIQVAETITPRLSSIVTSTHKVRFVYSNTKRRDLSQLVSNGFHPKDVLNINSNNLVEACQLNTIILESINGTCLKKVNFGSTYFYSNSTGFSGGLGGVWDGSDIFGNYHSDMRRLKLNSFRIASCSLNDDIEYKFEYFGNELQFTLPRRLSYSRDHYGYNNGKTTNNTLLPKIKIESSVSTPPTIDLDAAALADRETVFSEMLNGNLKDVTLPTGGVQTFEYEAHDVYRSRIQEVPATIENAFGVNCSFPGDPDCTDDPIVTNELTMVPTSTTRYKIVVTAIRNSPDANPTNLQFLHKSAAYGGNFVLSEEFQLNEANGHSVTRCYDLGDFLTPNDNKYTFKLDPYDSSPPHAIFLNIQVIKYTRQEVFLNNPIGGLRVKSIKSDPLNGEPPVIKSYKYRKSANSNESSGFLIGKPVYFEELPSDAAQLLTSNLNSCIPIRYQFNSAGVIGLRTLQGTHIGYSEITESVENDNAPFGKRVHTYTVDNTYEPKHIKAYPAVPEYFYNLDNVGYKDATNSKDANQVTKHTTDTDYVAIPNQPGGLSYKGKTYPTCSGMQGIVTRKFLDVVAYTNKSKLISLEKTTEIIDGVTNESEYTYNYNDQMEPTMVKTTNSNGDEYTTEYSYVKSYPDLGIKQRLETENRIYPAWKTVQKFDNTVIVDGSRTDFNYFNPSNGEITGVSDKVFPHKIFRYEYSENIDPINGTWELATTINKYNSNLWKPTEIIQDGWDKLSLEWSTKGSLLKWTYGNFQGANENKNHFKLFSYDPLSNLLSSTTDIDGQVTNFEYDDLLRLQWIRQRGTNIETEYTYNYIPNTVEARSSFNGLSDRTTVQTFDGLGRLLMTTKKEYNEQMQDVSSIIHYNNRGLVATQTDFDGNLTTSTYYPDPLNRKHTSIDPMSYIHTYEYGTNAMEVNGYSAGDLYMSKMTAPEGLISISFTDKRNRVIMSRQSDGTDHADTYTIYDNKDRAIKIVPPDATESQAGLTYAYSYDGADNMLTKKVPDMGLMEYAYDNRNLQIGMKDQKLIAEGKNWLITNYDNFGRPEKTGFGSISGVSGSIDELLTQMFYDGNGTNNTDKNYYKGKSDKSLINILDGYGIGTQYITNTYAYDIYGRTELRAIINPALSVNHEYDYTYFMDDNIHTEKHTIGPFISNQTFAYDHQGRLDSKKLSISGTTEKTVCSDIKYTNNDLIDSKKLRGGQELIDYSYNANNWLTRILVDETNYVQGLQCQQQNTTGKLFDFNIGYDNNNGPNIASINWEQANFGLFDYSFSYDFLNRIESATSADNGAYSTEYIYADKRGNIDEIRRNGYVMNTSCFSSQQIDDLKFSYNPGTNRLRQVADSHTETNCPDYEHLPQTDESGEYGVKIKLSSDGLVDPNKNVTYKSEDKIELQAGFKFSSDGTGTFLAINDDCPENNMFSNMGLDQYGFIEGSTQDYAYDLNGNLTHDTDKGITMSYNYLNLPYEALKNTNNKIEWLYTADGEKIKKTVTMAGQTPKENKYYGEIEEKNNNRTIYHDEGQVRQEGSIWHWEYALRDHLGNTRLVYEDSDNNGEIEVLQNNNYYPFGMSMYGEWNYQGMSDNDYKYNGKELNSEFGLGLYDYGFRFYDPSIGRFTGVDPLAHRGPGISPYAYSFNNPINFIDPDGRWPWPVYKAGLSAAWNSAKSSWNDYRSGVAGMKRSLELGYGPLSNTESMMVEVAAIVNGPAKYTSANDVTVLGTGQNMDGSRASGFDKVMAGIFVALPVSGSAVKNGLKYGLDNASDFYKSVVKMSTNDRIAQFKTVGAEFAEKNGLVKNNKLSKMNDRTIYSGENGTHYSLDTQHGHFEVLNSKGKHQGSIKFDGSDTGKGIQADHGIKIK